MKFQGMQAQRREVKAIAYAFLWLLLCATLSPAQSSKTPADKQKPKPVFSGTWQLDEEQAQRNKSKSASAARQLTLVIAQSEPEIKITRKVVSGGQLKTRESIYYSDERGETNVGAPISTTPNAQDEEIKSKTRWQGDKLITSARVRKAAAGTFLTWEIVDEWKLSPDGKTLTQKTTIKLDNSGADMMRSGRTIPSGQVIFVPAGANEFKRVFRRISD